MDTETEIQPAHRIDPVCVFHGIRRSQHECLVCCLCFKDLTREECNVTEDGNLEDVCKSCAEFEKEAARALQDPRQDL